MEEQIAVVTGGDGALAGHLCTALRDAGMVVHAPGRGDLDVCDAAGVAAYFASLDRLDLLVNQAGALHDGLVANMGVEAWDTVLDSHLKGAFLCGRAALRPMRKSGGGHLVQIGSYAALSGTRGQANYAAAKSGLIGLTKSLALEYGQWDIRANCILPGFLDLGMGVTPLERDREGVLSRHALGRLNTPEDAARFLVCLHGMRNVSGQVFQLDSRVGRWA